jgi:hypothetical protein
MRSIELFGRHVIPHFVRNRASVNLNAGGRSE